ncbi:hypothetical protein [Nubsella zeaxanthinifaciens]|uniref:hypothetical protein n=1 Tax=Nubsella zeaxanthinifaciens TaxID=392412 RepID=UPI000DE33028|nr:hypothetical protein [Nubsella zeaxanthinifaciens]
MQKQLKELRAGDRFHKASDKNRKVYQVAENPTGGLVKVKQDHKKVSDYMQAKTLVVYLRTV